MNISSEQESNTDGHTNFPPTQELPAVNINETQYTEDTLCAAFSHFLTQLIEHDANEPALDEEQEEAVQAMMKGSNVFLTGRSSQECMLQISYI